MLNLLSGIADVISSILSFVIHFFESFITFFNQIPRVFAFLTISINTLPNVLIIFATLSVSVYIFLFILGRQ